MSRIGRMPVAVRKSDPYKGKGLHLEGQRIRRKAGKTGKK